MPGFGAGGTTLSYTTGSSYKTNGAPDGQTMPGVGGLPQETVNHQYNQITGLPKGLTTTQAQSVYLNNTLYMFDGLVYERYLGVTGSRVRIQTNHGAPGRRLSSIYLNTETPGTQDDYGNSKLANDQYLYDPAGNITSIRSTANAVADQQECFRYDDHLRRLTEAWSQTPATCTTPQRTGPDAYWRQWVFDNLGNRHTETDKDPTAGDTTWTHTVGSPAGFKPHQVSSVTGSGPLAGAARSFEYHPDGTTKTRTTPQGTAQTLTWDKEGHLATLTGGGTTTTTYTYDTNGNRLIASNPSKKTLYLPDGTELEKTGTDDPLGTRHYAGIAVRDATGLRWIYADRNGTSMAQIDPATLVIHRQRSMPYGQPRGTQATSWKGTKGYVGGTKDDTGLTHLGAREYDPTLGRFISVDPIMDLADPQQWNAYAYAGGSPVTSSDPSGKKPCTVNDCQEAHPHSPPHQPARPPTVNNPRLQSILDDFYSAKNSTGTWIGRGTAADALRYELRTGNKVGPPNHETYHAQDAVDLMSRLSSLLEDNQKSVEKSAEGRTLNLSEKSASLTTEEIDIARAAAKDLYNALTTPDQTGKVIADYTTRGLKPGIDNAIRKIQGTYAVRDITGEQFRQADQWSKPRRIPRARGVGGIGNGISIAGDILFLVDMAVNGVPESELLQPPLPEFCRANPFDCLA